MDRPRLLIAVTSPMSAGFFKGQLAWLNEQGFDVHFLCSPGMEAEDIATSQQAVFHPVLLERQISPWRDAVGLWNIIRILRKLRPQIINAGTPKAGLLVILAAWICRVPERVYTIHGLRFETVRGPLRGLLITIERIVCLLASRVLCVSPSLREAAIGYGLTTAKKAQVLANGSINGIEIEEASHAMWRSAGYALRVDHKIPADALVIGFVGRLVRDKGIHELTCAWKLVSRQHPGIHLLIVGSAESGDRVSSADEVTLRSDNRVHFAGFLREVRPAYAAMSMLVLPTYREGLGLALLEAGAMGVPVVASDIAGCRDAVVHGVTGVLVPARDPDALAAAIDTYLNDSSLRERHGSAAAQYIQHTFSRAAVWRAIDEYYRSLLPGDSIKH